MKLGIDLDGVCYDFAGSLRMHLCQRGTHLPGECPPARRWEFYEDWGLTLDEFIVACHEGVDDGVVFSYGEPYPGTREALEAMRAAGHTLHIITDRSFGRNGASEAATRAWLDRHHLPFDSLTFSADKTVCRIDAMIDDKIANYDALESAGVAAFLLNRPWNDLPDNRVRVSSLAEFAEIVSPANV